MAEWQVLRDAIRIGRIDLFGRAERAAALGVLRRHQVAFPGAQAHRFAGASDLEALGYGFARFNSLGASHISYFLKKSGKHR
jgi:hypothetical protein